MSHLIQTISVLNVESDMAKVCSGSYKWHPVRILRGMNDTYSHAKSFPCPVCREMTFATDQCWMARILKNGEKSVDWTTRGKESYWRIEQHNGPTVLADSEWIYNDQT